MHGEACELSGSEPVAWAPAAPAEADGVFLVEMDGGFAIAEGVCNGGYVLGVIHQVARAALAAVGSQTTAAVAVSSQFLAPTPPGPALARVARLRTGRSLSRVDVELDAGGRTAVQATVVFTAPPDAPAETWRSVAPPTMTPAAACRKMPRCRGDAVPWPDIYWERVELLVDPGTAGFLDGTPSGRGEIKAWWSPRQRRVLDEGLLLVALDAMPPATMDLRRSVGRSPTVQLDARLYAHEVDLQGFGAPFLVRQQVLTAGESTADQACEVWDRSGRLLASATQVNWLR